MKVYLQGKFLGVELLGQRVQVFLVLLDNAKLLSIEAVLMPVSPYPAGQGVFLNFFLF